MELLLKMLFLYHYTKASALTHDVLSFFKSKINKFQNISDCHSNSHPVSIQLKFNNLQKNKN